jgi:LmbE family N-acetylglucosaminyl deacetylase
MANQRVLVVASHPDDEILGLGGTLARHADNGDVVRSMIMAEGATSRDDTRDAEGRRDELAELVQAAKQAANALGLDAPEMLGMPDNRMDSLPLLDVIKPIEHVVRAFQPHIVYTHHGGDLNVDHQVTHQAVMTACRPLPGSTIEAIYAFETVSSTEWATESTGDVFRPTRFVGIEDQLERKISALEAYTSEMAPFPHARSLDGVRALAALRGSSVGLKAAEAFMVLREVSR